MSWAKRITVTLAEKACLAWTMSTTAPLMSGGLSLRMSAIWVADASKRFEAAMRPYRAVAMGSMDTRLRQGGLIAP